MGGGDEHLDHLRDHRAVDRRADRLRGPAVPRPVGTGRVRRADRRRPSCCDSTCRWSWPSLSACSSRFLWGCCSRSLHFGPAASNLAIVTLGLGFTIQAVVFVKSDWIGEGLDGGTRIGSARLFGIDVDNAEPPSPLDGGVPRRIRDLPAWSSPTCVGREPADV